MSTTNPPPPNQSFHGITTDTVGTFAEAVGKEAFRPYFQDLMKLAFEGILATVMVQADKAIFDYRGPRDCDGTQGDLVF